MTQIDLSGTWQLHYGPHDRMPRSLDALDAAETERIDATVPGNVELDLVAAGRLASPERGERVYGCLPLEVYRWFYRRSFDTPDVEPCERAELMFDGIDTLAEVFLNGVSLGDVANMLIAHRFDVTDLLRRGTANDLVVRIDPVVVEGRKRTPTAWEFANGHPERLAVRKAAHMYGWDILPRLVSAGIWRPVRLEVLPATRWRDIYTATLRTDPAARTALLRIAWDFTTPEVVLDGWRVRARLERDDTIRHEHEEAIFTTAEQCIIPLEDIDLWWPRGYGEPALYDLTLDLLDAAGHVRATHRQRVGLRTVELHRSELTTPEDAGEFVFRINGERIFIKGTNHVPLDALHSRDPQHRDVCLDMVAELNCNMLRVWGGGVYEEDAFYDRCDAEGILVWQDFMLGCASYPQDDRFCEAVRVEAEQVIRRLRNHPSLALWAGNNENDAALQWRSSHAHLDPNDDRISRVVLADAVRVHDPHRDYLPSSPYISPTIFARGNKESERPEDHLWGPRDDFKGPYYTGSPAHFASEIGYHGCPSPASLRDMMDADHVWPAYRDGELDPQWRCKAVTSFPSSRQHGRRIALMANQIRVLFDRVPEDLEAFALASQISQAEALKFFIERFRIGKWRRTGILWWNLRDGWPVISDAIVGYDNRKKLAYEVVRRVQQDVCVMLAEPADGQHEVVVVNDTLAEKSGRLSVEGPDGQAMHDADFQIPASGRASVGQVPASPVFAPYVLRWQLEGGDQAVSHYLAGPRPFDLVRSIELYDRIGIIHDTADPSRTGQQT